MDGLEFYNDRLIAKNYLDFCLKEGCSAAEVILRFVERNQKGNSFTKNGFLIDLAAGSGTSILTLSKLGFKKYLAVDGAQEMLALLPDTVKKSGLTVEIEKMDLRSGNINATDSSAEMITCCSALMYVDEKQLEHVFSEAARLVKPNGLFGFNLVTHLNESTDSYSFNDLDETLNYVHSMRKIVILAYKHKFEIVDDSGYESPAQYLSGVIQHENAILLRKKKK